MENETKRKRQNTTTVAAERERHHLAVEVGRAYQMGKIYAWYEDGHSYTQIAERMDIPESSVRSLHQRALTITEKANKHLERIKGKKED